MALAMDAMTQQKSVDGKEGLGRNAKKGSDLTGGQRQTSAQWKPRRCFQRSGRKPRRCGRMEVTRRDRYKKEDGPNAGRGMTANKGRQSAHYKYALVFVTGKGEPDVDKHSFRGVVGVATRLRGLNGEQRG